MRHLRAATLEQIEDIRIYGGNRFIEDRDMMIGGKVDILAMVESWLDFHYAFSFVIFIWSLVKFQRPD